MPRSFLADAVVRVEYSQFRLEGVRSASSGLLTGPDDGLVVRQPLQSGYLRVTVTEGDRDRAPGAGWHGHVDFPVLVRSPVRVATWEGTPVAPLSLRPGRYGLVCAHRPDLITPEMELRSLQHRVTVCEVWVHFIAVELQGLPGLGNE